MKVTSWWKYNPFLHKPRALEPLVPWGSFFYYGPDPAAGVSYGCYDEKSTGFTVISMIAPQVYSPVTGEEMELITELNPEEAKKFFSKASSEQSSCLVCESCNTKNFSSLNIAEAPKVFCFACSSEIHQTMEAQTMGKKEEVAKTREKLEAQLQKVHALNPGESDDTSQFIGIEEIIKEIDNMNNNEEMSVEESPEESMEEAPLEEPAAEEPVMDESSDVEMEPMEEVGDDSAESCGPSMAMEAEHEKNSDEGEATADEEGEEIDLEAIVSKVKEKVEAHRERKASQAKRKEIRKRVLAKLKARQARAKLMTTKKEETKVVEEATAESTIEAKRAKMKEILAKKRKERAEAAEAAPETVETPVVEAAPETVETPVVEAAEEVETVEAAPETVETPVVEAAEEVETVEATEGLVDDKMEEHKAEKLEDNNDGSPELSGVKESDLNAANEGAEMHASAELRYETLAKLESLGAVGQNDIDMVLFGADTDNPTWAVFAKGSPVARIQLKSQDNAAEIRDVFASEDYALNLVKHCAEAGLVNTLKKVSAEFWANHVSNKEIADRYRSIAEAKIKEEKEAVIASFQEDFFNSVNTVVVGFNKNFFKNEGNALKNALLHNLVVAGLPENTAASLIEKSFIESSADFFGQLFDKTVEFMNKSEDAKSEIAQAILDCNVLTPESKKIVAGARIEDRLEQATAFASLSSNMQVVDNRVQVDTDDYKLRLKKAWRK